MTARAKTVVAAVLLAAVIAVYGYLTWRAVVTPATCPERGCEVRK